jgi:molybdate transport system substrate-binding protein
MMRACLPLIFSLFCLTMGCGKPAPEPVSISAAASTREPIERLAASFRTQTGVSVNISLGASSTLAKQIEEGGPADVFLAADEDWADYLEHAGLVARRQDLLTNRLAVVVPGPPGQARRLGALSKIEDLEGVERLALAGPAVPAGKYARVALTRAGIWERVKQRVISGKDVRATLVFVEQGEVDAGIVYKTDALVSSRVHSILDVPAELHPPIRYPLLLIRRPALRPEAKRFYDYLASPAGKAVFRDAGFGD